MQPESITSLNERQFTQRKQRYFFSTVLLTTPINTLPSSA